MFILKYNSIYVCTIFQEEWLEKLMLHFRTCLRKTSSQWCDGIRSENITDSLTDTFRNCLETLSHLKLNYQQIYLHRWMDVARTWHLISSVDSHQVFPDLSIWHQCGFFAYFFFRHANYELYFGLNVGQFASNASFSFLGGQWPPSDLGLLFD